MKKVLKPVKGTEGGTRDAWRALGVERGPGEVPSGMVLGFEVYDPRLRCVKSLPLSFLAFLQREQH